MNKRNFFRTLALLPLLATPLAALANPTYTATFLPAEFVRPGHMNNAGVVAGTVGNVAATWSDAGISAINSLGPYSSGMAINNRGEIGGSWGNDGYFYSAGAVQTVGTLGRPWEQSTVVALNDVGQAAGSSHYGLGESRSGFVFSGGVMQLIPTLGGFYSYGAAINNAGVAVGTSAINSGSYGSPTRHAIIFQGGVMQDLGTFGGLSSEAQDINDAGQVVGWADTVLDARDGQAHAFLYEHGTMTDLGFIGGHRASAGSINSAGMIVGKSEWSDAQPKDYHAFLYTDHQMVDLNSLVDLPSGWRLISAGDINDAGQILATACPTAAACATVRLDLISAVPEPQEWGMLLAGLMLVGARRRLAGARRKLVA